VENNCVIRQPDFLKRLFGQKTIEINFQNQGIGSQLLLTMITYARSKGLTRIESHRPENDARRDSLLAQWLQKRGFKADEAAMFMDLKTSAEDDSQYMPKP
jgi:N-acetylglutamate synthase-like GNAT family acetyltransferase